MEALIGPQPGKIAAETVRHVLDLAFEKGHPDPRHSEHWWDWRDWPFDGRQWSYDGSVNRYKLDKQIHAEWKRRQNFPPNSGMEGSELRVERKLEGGVLWGEKQFPNGRTSLRSSRSICHENPNKLRDHLFMEACDLKKRSSYDASIMPNKPMPNLPMDDKFKHDYLEEYYGADISGEIITHDVLGFKFFGCTGSFATRGEQDDEDNSVPSLLIAATVVYETSPGVLKNVLVIAETPIRSVMTDFADLCHDRVAGFVISDEGILDDEGHTVPPSSAVTVTYVESCQYDLDTLDHDEKDAVLEDRALTVHRLLKNCPGVDTHNMLLEVSSPRDLPAVKPEAGFMPPERMVTFSMTVHRADPRWPLVKPNSVCLECGKDPTTTGGGKLLHCSKCGVRKFCSGGCMAKSWNSDTWSHKVECKSWCKIQQSQVGTSMEGMFKQCVEESAVPIEDDKVDATLSLLQETLGEATLNETYESVEEMRDGLRQRAKQNRKAKRDGKKGKKKGKKKK